MWAINANDIVDFDGHRWLVTMVRSFNGQMDLLRFGEGKTEYGHAYQNDVAYVQHRPMSVPAMAELIGKREPEHGVTRGDVILSRNSRDSEAREYIVTNVSPNGVCAAMSRDGKAEMGFPRNMAVEIIGHEEIEPRGGRFRADIVFDAIPDDEICDVAAGFLNYLENTHSNLFFAGLSIDGLAYGWEDISAYNQGFNQRGRLHVDDLDATFILVKEAAAKGSVIREAYSDSEKGVVVEFRPDEQAYYVETEDLDAFTEVFERISGDYNGYLCGEYREDDEWEDDECDPVFRIGEWVKVGDAPDLKPIGELEADGGESPNNEPPKLGEGFIEHEACEIGYDKIAVFKCERWFIDSIAEGGLMIVHRIEKDGSVNRVEIQESQARKPNDVRAVKDYLEASASTFCGDTCPECGTKIRMKDVTRKRMKAAPVDEACGVEHQDKGETSWNWACPECGHEGSIVESYPLCSLALPYEIGDKVRIEGAEYVVVGGDASKRTYHAQIVCRGDEKRTKVLTNIKLGAENWFET